MRANIFLALIGLVGCSNDVDPRVIPGGGVGDGEIDGEVNVYIINGDTEAPISGATVAIGTTEKTTDATGLVTFTDVEGPQTIIAKMTGYRSQVWVDVNGANATLGLKPTSTATVPQATLSGSISNWTSITVPQGHLKGASAFYSQTDDLGDPANNLMTPLNGQRCGGNQPDCNWTLVTRTGPVTIMAVIFDYDPMGTPMESDDVLTVLGYAYKTGVMVEDGVGQTGLQLTIIEAGNLETITGDLGTPPPALMEHGMIAGIELSKDEIIQIGFQQDMTTALVPKRTLFGEATYRLTAIAQTTSGDMGAQSILLRQGLTGPTLSAGTWLETPTGVMVTRTSASFTGVASAKAHSVTWEDANGNELLEITLFNSKKTQVDVPTLVALPTSGTLTARVAAIGADFDVNDFSLEEDSDLLWGISAQPMPIP